MENTNCPNCGASTAFDLRIIKRQNCAQCGTTLFLAGQENPNTHDGGIMLDAPLLVHVGDQIVILGEKFEVLGHARFDYGRGYWDEFCLLSSNGRTTKWLNVDEGDISLQKKALSVKTKHKFRDLMRLGKQFVLAQPVENSIEYQVSEFGKAKCIALRGGFDEILYTGQTYEYLDALGDGNSLLTAEHSNGETEWFIGNWIDPFDIERN